MPKTTSISVVDDPVMAYLQVRSRNRSFPHGFWKGSRGNKRARTILRYVVETELNMPIDEVPKKLRVSTLKERGLQGMVSQAFDDSIHKAILDTYQGRFKPWEFAKNPKGLWRGAVGEERCREAVRWLVEEKLGIRPEEAPKRLRQTDFQKNGLGWMFAERGITIVEAVMNAYPGRFKPWEFAQVSKRYWKGDNGKRNARKATRWLMEERLRIPKARIPNLVTHETFREAGLTGMLVSVYDGSYIKAVLDAYPGVCKPWHFTSAPSGYWKGVDGEENARDATRWLIAELGIGLDNFPLGITSGDFSENGLGGMLVNMYRGSVYDALRDAFPGVDIKPWQLAKVPGGYWAGGRGRSHARQATRWLVEERLGLGPQEAPGKLERKHFRANGLWGMLNVLYNNSEFRAFDDAYPGLFKQWEFGSVHNDYWSGKGGKSRRIEAVRWLVDDKLKLSREDIPRFLTRRLFDENHLSGLISHLYNGSVYEALDEGYPGEFTQEELLEGALKRVNFHQRLGRSVEKILLRYLADYCERKAILHEIQKDAARGRVDFWMEDGLAFDITTSRTREGIRAKWKKKKYQEDPGVENLWIVVVAGTFSSLDYREMNKESPENVCVLHYTDLFTEFGPPSRAMRLELEALALMTPRNAKEMRADLEKAIVEGQEHIYSAEKVLNLVQSRLTEF